MTSLESLTPSEAREEIDKINGRGKWSRRNKYNACKTVVGNLRFDSKKEAECWQYLRARERAGEIKALTRQVRYELFAYCASAPGDEVPRSKVCTYVADFRYFDNKRNAWITADAKGVKTALFTLKAKLMKANHGIEVELM